MTSLGDWGSPLRMAERDIRHAEQPIPFSPLLIPFSYTPLIPDAHTMVLNLYEKCVIKRVRGKYYGIVFCLM